MKNYTIKKWRKNKNTFNRNWNNRHKSDYLSIDNKEPNILENNKIHELNINITDYNEKISEEEEKLNNIEKNDNILNTNKIDSSKNTTKLWKAFFR